MHYNCELLFKKYALEYFTKGLKVIEIGAGGFPTPYQLIVSEKEKEIEWHNLDLSFTSDINLAKIENYILSENEYCYPIADNTYDIVFSAGTICNVKKAWVWFHELHRILKPNGILIILAPVSYPYHPAPVDTWRVYPEGLKALFEECEMETIFCEFYCLELEGKGYSHNLLNIANLRVAGYSFVNPITNQLSSSNKIKMFINRFVRFIPYIRRFMSPVQVAYDTIGIARKK